MAVSLQARCPPRGLGRPCGPRLSWWPRPSRWCYPSAGAQVRPRAQWRACINALGEPARLLGSGARSYPLTPELSASPTLRPAGSSESS